MFDSINEQYSIDGLYKGKHLFHSSGRPPCVVRVSQPEYTEEAEGGLLVLAKYMQADEKVWIHNTTRQL